MDKFIIDFEELKENREIEEVAINAKIPTSELERFKKNIGKIKNYKGYGKTTQKKVFIFMIKKFNEYVERLD